MNSFMKCSLPVLRVVLFSIFCLFCAISGKANYVSVTIGGVKYSLYYDYYGLSDYYAYVSDDNQNFSGTSVTIPESISHTVSYQENGEIKSKTLDFPVTSIQSNAFNGCSNLTSVTIGNRVEKIDTKAFSGCSSITDLCVGDSVRIVYYDAFSGVSPKNLIWKPKKYYTERYTTSGYKNFEEMNIDCSNVEVLTILSPAERLPNNFCSNAKITSVNVPDHVTYVGTSAFSECSNLKRVTIGSGVIGTSAFSGCSNLTSVTIGDKVTSVGSSAFANCSEVAYLSIGASVSTVGSKAFDGVSPQTLIWKAESCRFYSTNGLTTDMLINCDEVVVLQILSPASVLPTNFFNGSKIPSVSFPNTITSISKSFNNCANLVNISFSKGAASISSSFNNCANLASVDFSNGVNSISGFNYCGNLTNINLRGVEYIGEQSSGMWDWYVSPKPAFSNCPNLTEVNFPNTVKRIIGFNYCTGLTSINIPSSVTELSYMDMDEWHRWSFLGCCNVSSITVDEANEVFDSRDNCNAIIESDKNILLIACNNTFIPETVTSLLYCAFTHLNIDLNIDCINIPSTLVSLGVYKIGSSFYGETNINPFTYIKNLSRITVDQDNPVFDSRDGCNAIIETESNTLIAGCNTTVIPNSVTSISEDAFTGSGITNIVIPSSVESVSGFRDCTDLTSITCKSTTPPDCDLWDTLYGQATLYVPRSALQDYKEHWGWGSFLNIVGIGGGGWIDLPGDVDGDGKVNIDDVTTLIQILLTNREYQPSADVDGNGKISIDDVTTLIQILLTGIMPSVGSM